MAATVSPSDLSQLPLPPRNPLSTFTILRAARELHTFQETLRDAGGSVTRFKLAPTWLMPEWVLVASPQAAHDILGRTGDGTDRNTSHDEMARLFGASLFTLHHTHWLPRRRTLQPIFTKPSVRAFGGHMAQAADTIAAGWGRDNEIDLDRECRRLTMRVLGRSVLGIDLDERADEIAEPLRTAIGYVTARVTKPLTAPYWLPTPARRRARASVATLRRVANEVLRACREDPTRDAPLVRALITATDPATGRSLTDEEICNELISFMLAGHDTTATMLTYALWALGHHPDMQDKVRREATGLGDRELTPNDVSHLRYTVQVLHEALRLCPPGAAHPRLVSRDIDVAGFRVKAGTACCVSVYAMHRDPTLWDRPLEFDPDRFTAENAKTRDRWRFIPFGAGPRTCIGDHFAMLEATLALATIIRRAEIRSLDDDFPMAFPFTLVAAAPIRVHVNSPAGTRKPR
jgi:cytochrome P450